MRKKGENCQLEVKFETILINSLILRLVHGFTIPNILSADLLFLLEVNILHENQKEENSLNIKNYSPSRHIIYKLEYVYVYVSWRRGVLAIIGWLYGGFQLVRISMVTENPIV